MFETAVLANGPSGKRVWTTCLGMTGEAVMVALAIVIPLMYPAMLPKPEAVVTWISPPQPPPPPPGGDNIPLRTVRVVRTQFNGTELIMPTRIPVTAQILDDPPMEPPTAGVSGGIGIPGGIRGGVPGALIRDLIGSVAAPVLPRPAPAAPAPKPPAAPAPPRIIRISSIEQAVPISRPDPVYPAMALRLRISGVVRLEGIIGTDGRIKELKVLGGNAWLVRAALDAVSQWTYRPTILNGEPVEVVAPIAVTFVLK